METLPQTVERLLTVIEDLADQEMHLLRAGDYPSVLKTQQRMAPVVDRLVELRVAAADSVRLRIAAVGTKRRKSDEMLAASIVRARAEHQQTEMNLKRLTQFKPAYGLESAGSSRLLAQG